MKKLYKEVKLFTNRNNEDITYVLSIETNEGHRNEFYEFSTRQKAFKAYKTAIWLINHPFAKQSFEKFENAKANRKVLLGMITPFYKIMEISKIKLA